MLHPCTFSFACRPGPLLSLLDIDLFMYWSYMHSYIR